MLPPSQMVFFLDKFHEDSQAAMDNKYHTPNQYQRNYTKLLLDRTWVQCMHLWSTICLAKYIVISGGSSKREYIWIFAREYFTIYPHFSLFNKTECVQYFLFEHNNYISMNDRFIKLITTTETKIMCKNMEFKWMW